MHERSLLRQTNNADGECYRNEQIQPVGYHSEYSCRSADDGVCPAHSEGIVLPRNEQCSHRDYSRSYDIEQQCE